jgi:hypothetical protein
VNKKPNEPIDKLVHEFVKFVNSKEGQEVVAAVCIVSERRTHCVMAFLSYTREDEAQVRGVYRRLVAIPNGTEKAVCHDDIQGAGGTLSPGDTLYIRNGTYTRL